MMASTLLRRHLARASPALSPRPATISPSLIPRRTLCSTSVRRQAEPVTDSRTSAQTGARGVFDTHTVEDLHGMSAADILLETGTRKDAQMRHFTGTPVLSPYLLHAIVDGVDAVYCVQLTLGAWLRNVSVVILAY